MVYSGCRKEALSPPAIAYAPYIDADGCAPTDLRRSRVVRVWGRGPHLLPEKKMSRRNGDRARFQKERRRKMLRRQRIQKLTAAARTPTSK